MILRVNEILEERGMKKADLCRRTGLTQSNLNAAIKDGGNPTIETLKKIAKALDVEVHELLTDKLPSRQEAVLFINGEAYSLIKTSTPGNLTKYSDSKALRDAVEVFVERCANGRQNASFSAFSSKGELFTVFFLFDGRGEGEQFLLSITSGGENAYTCAIRLDEYQAESDDDCFEWDEKAVAEELCHNIEGIDRGKVLYNTTLTD